MVRSGHGKMTRQNQRHLTLQNLSRSTTSSGLMMSFFLQTMLNLIEQMLSKAIAELLEQLLSDQTGKEVRICIADSRR